MNKPYVVTKGVILKWFLIGMFSGFGFLGIASYAMQIEQSRIEAEQQKSLRSCRLPDTNGAMSVYIMESEQIRCWRWK